MNNSPEWTLHIELFGKFRIYRTRVCEGKEEREELNEVLNLDPKTQKLLAFFIAKCGVMERKDLIDNIIERIPLDIPKEWLEGRASLAKEWAEESDEDKAKRSFSDYLYKLRKAFDKIASHRTLKPTEYQLAKNPKGIFLKLENVQEPKDARWVRITVEAKVNGQKRTFDRDEDVQDISQGKGSRDIKLGRPTDEISIEEVRLTWNHELEGRLHKPDINQLHFELNPDGKPSWWVDIVAFEEAATEGLRTNNRAKLHEALKLYKGEFLGHFKKRELEDWIIEKRDLLLRLCLKVVEGAAIWSTVPPSFGLDLIRYFLDRKNEIKEVKRALLDEGKKIVLVGGFGGIGKTSVGLMVCWRLIRQATFTKFIWISAQLRWIDEETGEIVDEIVTKRKEAHALSLKELWDEILKSAGMIPLSIPDPDKKREVRAVLRENQWLIFIDNLESARNVEMLLQELQDVLAESSSKALLTSREVPKKVRLDAIIPLRGLDEGYTLELIKSALKVDEVPPGAEKIHEFAKGNPLVTKIIASQLDGIWEDVYRDLEAAKAEVERLSEIKVELKDDKVEQGTLIDETIDTITIQTDSRKIRIKRADIKRVTTIWRGGPFTFIYWGTWQKLSRLSRRVLIYIGKTAVAPVPKKELKIAFLPDPQLHYDEPELLRKRQEDLQEVLWEILGRRPELDELEQALDEGLGKALQELNCHYLLESSPHIRQEEKRYGVHPLTREFVRSDLPKIWQLAAASNP